MRTPASLRSIGTFSVVCLPWWRSEAPREHRRAIEAIVIGCGRTSGAHDRGIGFGLVVALARACSAGEPRGGTASVWRSVHASPKSPSCDRTHEGVHLADLVAGLLGYLHELREWCAWNSTQRYSRRWETRRSLPRPTMIALPSRPMDEHRDANGPLIGISRSQHDFCGRTATIYGPRDHREILGKVETKPH